MSALVSGYEYDIFISYRQKDNKYDGWVMEFVQNLKSELEATFKEEITIYCDENPTDGLLETHNVDKSLEGKLKCLIFIPIISRIYCDPKSFAWRNEFVAFNKLACEDSFGRDIKLSSGNVASRILPVRIHDLDPEDKALIENEIRGELRPVDFIYREVGVNRPLKPADNKYDNRNKTDYRNQINKTANSIKEIIGSMQRSHPANSNLSGGQTPVSGSRKLIPKKPGIPVRVLIAIFSLVIIAALVLSLNKYYKSDRNARTGKNFITSNARAYEWYKKAELRLTPDNSDDVDSSIYFLTKAIEADSTFALAHAQLSRAYYYKNYFNTPDDSYSEKAYLEAETSLYLNPNLAEGYFAKALCGWTFKNKFPHEKTIRGYKKAISKNPKLSEAYASLGAVYFHVGLMQESFEALKKSLKINPDNKIASLNLISYYVFTRERFNLEKAVELYKQTPDHQITPMRVSFWAEALITLGRTGEAENILYAGLKKDSSDLFINSSLAILLAKNGDTESSLKRIKYCEGKNLSTGHFHHVVYNLAIAYALLGFSKESVEKLKWVADNGFPNYALFHNDPLLASLHNYTPYNELLTKLEISLENFRKVAKE